MSKLIFNLSKAKVTFKKKDVYDIKPKSKKVDKRYVIYRYMGVAGKIILMVYDKWERTYVYKHQAPIEKGYDVTKSVKSMYRNHEFKDNITDDALFEI